MQHAIVSLCLPEGNTVSKPATPIPAGQANAGPGAGGRNLFAAATPSAMNAINTIPCARANGGSVWVGARAWKKATF